MRKQNHILVLLVSLIVIGVGLTLSLQSTNRARQNEEKKPDAQSDSSNTAAPPQQLLQQAEQSEAEGEFELALSFYEQVKDQRPRWAAIRLKIAGCQAILRQKQEAIQTLRGLLAMSSVPVDAETQARAALQELLVPTLSPRQREDWREALTQIEAGEELKKNGADNPENRNQHPLSDPLFRKAIDLLGKIVQDKPDYAPALLSLAVAHEHLSNFTKAAEGYRRFLDFGARNHLPELEQQRQIRQRMLICERRQRAAPETVGDDQELPFNYDKWIPDSSSDQKIHYAHHDTEFLPHKAITVQEAFKLITEAAECEEAGACNKGIMLCVDVLKAYPDFLQARYRLAQCYRHKGDKDKAISQFRRVARVCHGDFIGTVPSHSDTLLAEACEEVEKLSLPRLTQDQATCYADAVAYYEAAKSLYARAYQLADKKLAGTLLSHESYAQYPWSDGMRVTFSHLSEFEEARLHTRFFSLGKAINDRAEAAQTLLRQFLEKQPDYGPAFAELGMAYQLSLELALKNGATDEARPKGRAALRLYLDWYKKLDIPETSKVREMRSRLREMEVQP